MLPYYLLLYMHISAGREDPKYRRRGAEDGQAEVPYKCGVDKDGDEAVIAPCRNVEAPGASSEESEEEGTTPVSKPRLQAESCLLKFEMPRSW